MLTTDNNDEFVSKDGTIYALIQPANIRYGVEYGTLLLTCSMKHKKVGSNHFETT